ncbi:MAG: hypothetical protein AAGJ82_12740 [Bacteroidota bacterium]
MMTIGRALRGGIVKAWSCWRAVLLLYLGLLGAALLGAVPWRSLLAAEAGQSLLLKDLIKGFDYTVLNDFVQTYGAGLAPALSTTLGAVVLFFFVYLFLLGGTLAVVISTAAHFERATFWAGAGSFFGRLLRLTLFFWVLHGLLLAAFGGIYWKVTKGLSPQALDSEGIITASLNWLVPLYLFFLSFLLMWQDYAKLQVVRLDRFWNGRAIRSAASIAFGRLRLTYPTYLLLLGGQVICWWAFHQLDMAIVRTDSARILLAIVLFQVALLLRLFWRVANWGAIGEVLRKSNGTNA